MMNQKPLTLIVSDLHMGDGGTGDDFVDHDNQFSNFVDAQAKTEHGKNGGIELVINGDFLEFVQVRPEVYKLNSQDYWCSETESLSKLESIIQGHPQAFRALADFQKSGNVVTIFAGNHDVDLYWEKVRDRLKEVAGNLNIELGRDTYTRYDERLHISHGHLFPTVDTVNGFAHWSNPVLRLPDDNEPPRLEMCAGTLFVVRLVNPLEAKYPFADNLHPETELLRILWREDRWGLLTVGWLGGRFLQQHFGAALSTKAVKSDIGAQILDAIRLDPFFRKKIAGLCDELLGMPGMTADEVLQRYKSAEDVEQLLAALLAADGTMAKWIDVFDLAKPATSAIGATRGETLNIIETGRIDVRAACATIARGKWKAGAEIVVLGHTHIPEQLDEDGRKYYNPGSWTRYVDDPSSLKLDDLANELAYPYRLNYIRVEEIGGRLQSDFICIEKQP